MNTLKKELVNHGFADEETIKVLDKASVRPAMIVYFYIGLIKVSHDLVIRKSLKPFIILHNPKKLFMNCVKISFFDFDYHSLVFLTKLILHFQAIDYFLIFLIRELS